MPAPTSDFVASTHQGIVIVTRGDNKFRIEMSPAETDKATHAVSLSLSMVGLEYVPKYITNTPFVVRFFPNRVMALERVDKGDSMPFRVNEGDDLIKVLQMAHGMCLNEQTHGRAVPVGPATVDYMAGDEPL